MATLRVELTSADDERASINGLVYVDLAHIGHGLTKFVRYYSKTLICIPPVQTIQLSLTNWS